MATYRPDPKITASRLAVMSRSPFMDKLSQALDHGPDDAAITALANRNPDRYAQYIAIFARLAGYTDKLEVEATFTHSVAAMSDAELEQARDKMLADLRTTCESPSPEARANP